MKERKPDTTSDITAITAYKPRQEAVAAILEGRFDDYLSWARGDGYFAAYGFPAENPGKIDLWSVMPIDRALLKRIRIKWGVFNSATLKTRRAAFNSVPHFFQSPMEIILRAGSADVLDKAVRRAGADKKKSMRAGSRPGFWAGGLERALLALAVSDGDMIPLIRFVMMEKPPLILLAVILGKTDAALLMQRGGMAIPGEGSLYVSCIEAIMESVNLDKEKGGILETIRDALGLPGDTDFRAAADWFIRQDRKSGSLDELFSSRDFPGNSAAIDEALKNGAPVSYFPLMVASEAGETDILKALFKAGGDANSKCKGSPAFINIRGMTAEVREIWSRAGYVKLPSRD